MRKFLFCVLGVFLFSSVSAFYDLSPEDPDLAIFSHLRDVKIMRSFDDGNFHPEKLVTRAEALTIALRAGGIVIPQKQGSVTFQDVSLESWYAPIVARAIETKVVSAHSPFFRPEEPVNKAEFLAFLLRATGVRFGNYIPDARNIALDVKEEDWFMPIFAYVKKYQISQLSADMYYRPYKLLSRREVAVMTFRQLKLFHGEEGSKVFVELQAHLQQFMTLLQAGQETEATVKIQRILALTEELTRMQNNHDAIAARAITQSLENFVSSLRYMKSRKTLAALESLYLAEKHAQRAAEKSQNLEPFAKELSALVGQAIQNFSGVRSNLAFGKSF